MRFLSALAAMLTLSVGLPAKVLATDPGSTVAMSVTPDGVLNITLGGKLIAAGHWQAIHFGYDNIQPDETVVGPIVSTAVSNTSPTHATVTDTYSAAKVTDDITLDGQDLRIATHLENLDKAKSIKKVNFVGLSFEFDKPATGTLSSWHWSYLTTHGLELFHPSLAEPIGVVYAHDDRFGFSVYSESEFDRQCMFHAEFQKDGIIPADCHFQFFTNRIVPPGQAIDVDMSLRISTDTSIPNLLAPYKKVYEQHFPTLLYHPDTRAVAAFTGVGDQRSITRANPYGFLGAFRRLDSAAGTNAYIRLIAPPLERAGALGIIFWSPGGYHPPMYPPDFDVFPKAVQDNIPALVSGFKKRGLRVGLCARCGDGVIREEGKDPVLYRLSAEKPSDMKTLIERFHHAMDMGFDLFYLDSFGNQNPNDQEILKQVRTAVGPDVQLYTEFCTDMSLPYAGRYCEWQGGNAVTWTSADQYQQMKFLSSDSVWLCIVKSGNPPVPPEFKKLGLTPLVMDTLCNHLPDKPPPQ